MQKSRLFQIALLWSPSEKQVKEEGLKAKIILEPKTVLAVDEQTARTIAAMSIPEEYKEQLDQIDVVVRPF